MKNTQSLIKLINQIFDLEKKVAVKTDINQFKRNFKRIQDSFEELGFLVLNPIGEPYIETRTDCEATIAGTSVRNLVVTEVIKPVVYGKLDNNEKHLLQKGLFVVEGR